MQKLLQAYRQQKLIPFLGAGLSVPFKIPNWRNLILKIGKTDENYENFKVELKTLLDRNEFCQAVSCIKEHSKTLKKDTQINKCVCRILDGHMKDLEPIGFQIDNNYEDLLKLRFSNYFTFNYDSILENVSAEQGKDLHIKLLDEETLDTQFLPHRYTEDAVVWHVHGAIPRSETIVLSGESYEKRYADERYCKNLEFWINSHVFLFVGVSFQDPFVREMFERNKKIFSKNRHYMMLPETEEVPKDDLLLKYGVKVIPYSVQKGYVVGIRECLDRLFREADANRGVLTEKGTEIERERRYKTEIHIRAKNAPVLSGEYQNNTLYFS